jgi:hypothetical protein
MPKVCQITQLNSHHVRSYVRSGASHTGIATLALSIGCIALELEKQSKPRSAKQQFAVEM